MDILWVAQEESNGCAVASLAMVTDQTYWQVRNGIPYFDNSGGLTWFHTNSYLAEHGYAVAMKFPYVPHLGYKRTDWPVVPFADMHLCQVRVSGGAHYVVMLADGTVLDPATPERKRIGDYSEVDEVIGVVRIAA